MSRRPRLTTAELANLETRRASSSAPWFAGRGGPESYHQGAYVFLSTDADGSPTVRATMNTNFRETSEADVAYAVALEQAAPSLIAEVREARRHYDYAWGMFLSMLDEIDTRRPRDADLDTLLRLRRASTASWRLGDGTARSQGHGPTVLLSDEDRSTTVRVTFNAAYPEEAAADAAYVAALDATAPALIRELRTIRAELLEARLTALAAVEKIAEQTERLRRHEEESAAGRLTRARAKYLDMADVERLAAARGISDESAADLLRAAARGEDAEPKVCCDKCWWGPGLGCEERGNCECHTVRGHKVLG